MMQNVIKSYKQIILISMPFPENDIWKMLRLGRLSTKLRPESQKLRRPPETEVSVRNVLCKAISVISWDHSLFLFIGYVSHHYTYMFQFISFMIQPCIHGLKMGVVSSANHSAKFLMNSDPHFVDIDNKP